jgi:hypothetical protein
MAQRMESVASPGGVMLSASTARLVEGTADLGEPELVRIKGAGEPVPAHRLLGMAERDRALGRAESNLVGRRWEMSAVEGLLDRAIDGHGMRRFRHGGDLSRLVDVDRLFLLPSGNRDSDRQEEPREGKARAQDCSASKRQRASAG